MIKNDSFFQECKKKTDRNILLNFSFSIYKNKEKLQKEARERY